jgi:hypothetical protein
MRHSDLHDGAELVESLTYRQAHAPTAPAAVFPWSDWPLLLDAPRPLRAIAASAWALVSTAVAACLVLVLVLLVHQLIGWLT